MKFLPISSFFVSVFVAFNFVSAQEDLSITCQQGLDKISSTPEFNNCASFLKLASLQNPTNDPKPIYDSYCSATKCSESTTSAAADDLKSQCQTELTTKDSFTTYLKTVLVFNSPLKDSLCFKDSSGGYCNLDPTHPEAESPGDLESFQTFVISKCDSSFLDGTVPNTTGS
ncbi:hypothetical protein C2G38_2137849 [Gigaspora rosea]|uniref:Secreted protein n=1 Tax=Gigaspora rosea TaxID=44941 RepID=A0A397VZH9_9GLOM|nr:hypothetical protein C2G38_2137849 [Gigaspora rosea]